MIFFNRYLIKNNNKLKIKARKLIYKILFTIFLHLKICNYLRVWFWRETKKKWQVIKKDCLIVSLRRSTFSTNVRPISISICKIKTSYHQVPYFFKTRIGLELSRLNHFAPHYFPVVIQIEWLLENNLFIFFLYGLNSFFLTK